MPQIQTGSSIGGVGESLNGIAVDLIPPAPLEEIFESLEAIRQRLGTTGPGVVVAEAIIRLTQAAEAQASARADLTDFLGRIGWQGSSQERGRAQTGTTELHPKFTFRERPGPKGVFIAIGEDGTIRPRDPLTGEIMWPGEIPKSLLADEQLRAGFEFWQGPGKEVPFRMLLCSHDSGERLAEAGIDLRAEAQRIKQVDGTLFIEGVGFTAEKIRLNRQFNRVSRLTDGQSQSDEYDDPLLQGQGPGNAFLTAVLGQVKGTKVNVAFPDYCPDSTRPSDIVLLAWDMQIEDVYGDGYWRYDPSGLRMIERFQALHVGNICYRDLYLLGKIGHNLHMQHISTGKLPRGVAFLTGAAHENIGRILQDMGVEVTMAGGASSDMTKADIDCVRRFEVTAQDIERKERLISEA